MLGSRYRRAHMSAPTLVRVRRVAPWLLEWRLIMVDKNAVVSHITDMALNEPDMNPFGKRYAGDRRYRPWCLAGSGNGYYDRWYGHVDGIQFELEVNHHTHTVDKCRLLNRDEYFNVY